MSLRCDQEDNGLYVRGLSKAMTVPRISEGGRRKVKEMSEVRTLLLRCDCSVEHLDLDVWLKPGAEAHTMSLDESYLTVSSELSTSRWRDRLKASWTILRGRTHLLHSVILSPESVAKLRDFAKELPDEGMAR